MRSRSTRLFAAVLTISLGVPAIAMAQPADTPPPATRTTPSVAGTSAVVTLITGDRITLEGPTERLRVRSIERPASRQGLVVHQTSRDGRLSVIPEDAAVLIAAGRLDPRLFDVTGLVEQGLVDEKEPEIRVLTTSDEAVTTFSAPAHTTATSSAASIGMHGLAVERDQAEEFWSELTGEEPQTFGAAGFDKLWLDAKAHATLDESVSLIGAPTAWDSGFTGDGVSVAILDTGYDAGHPDLAGRVIAEENFSTESSVQDGDGHGTHVASTIAGTGAASDGAYRGVAPDADLLIAKVLDDYGSGYLTDIIAGAEWAVAQGADVANLSLGSDFASEDDPLSEAIDTLSADSETLFVVAAGNVGGPGTVGSPATADRALAVGSTTKTDELSYFSSRGPRNWDFGIKPEIAGPGEDIVAARAAGTSEEGAVGEHYTAMSGTSMAAPHVAGAAALAAQARPNVTGEELKALLTSTATPLADVDFHGQGAGRLDAARAVDQSVRAETTGLGFGVLPWPHDDAAPQTSSVSYRNDGSEPVTLDLSLDMANEDGSPSPDGLFTLAAERIEVPAGENAEVAVVLAPTTEGLGRHVGRLIATSADQRIVTPVSAHIEEEMHQLNLDLVDASGRGTWFAAEIRNVETDEAYYVESPENSLNLRVPPGSYQVWGHVQIMRDLIDDGALIYFADQAQMSADQTLTVDTAVARPANDSVERSDARRISVSTGFSMNRGDGMVDYAIQSMPGSLGISTIQSPEIAGLDFHFGSNWEQPMAALTVVGEESLPFEAGARSIGGFDGVAEGELIDVTHLSHDEIPDLTNRIPLITGGSGLDEPAVTALIEVLAERGAELVLEAWGIPGEQALPLLSLAGRLDVARLHDRLAAGPVHVIAEGHDHSSYAYFLADRTTDGVPGEIELAMTDEDFGMVAAEYRTPATIPLIGISTFSGSSDGFVPTAWSSSFVRLPQTRTEYYLPDFEWTARHHVTDVWEPVGQLESLPFSVEAGSEDTELWFGAPFGPTLSDEVFDVDLWDWSVPAARTGNSLRLALPMFGDDDPRHAARTDSSDSGVTTLSRDGVELGIVQTPGIAEFYRSRRFWLVRPHGGRRTGSARGVVVYLATGELRLAFPFGTERRR